MNTGTFSRREILHLLAAAGAGWLLQEAVGWLPDIAAQNNLTALPSLSLLELLNRPLEHNVLKLFRAAADPVRNRVFVAGIMTPPIGILDAATEQWIGTVNSGFDTGNGLKYLAYNATTDWLYVRNATSNVLNAIDVAQALHCGLPLCCGGVMPC